MAYTTTDLVYSKLQMSTSDVSSADVTQFITWADNHIENVTGKKYDTSSSTKTDYFDLITNKYERDWDLEDGIITGAKPYIESRYTWFLTQTPVYSVDHVYFLDRTQEISKLFSYASSAYTDNTSEANSARGTPFYAFASSVSIGDIMYVGCSDMFFGMELSLSTVGVGGVLVWEYYNGSAWTTLTVSETVSGADDLNASGKISWSLPADWQETTVNSNEYYWVRARVSTAHSTSPLVNEIKLVDVVSDELGKTQYYWDSAGRVFLITGSPSEGVDVVRVDYTIKVSSVPTSVQRLSTALAAREVVSSLLHSGYDDVVSGGEGSEQWSKGEKYANLRVSIEMLTREIEGDHEKGVSGLWDEVGKRITFMVI